MSPDPMGITFNSAISPRARVFGMLGKIRPQPLHSVFLKSWFVVVLEPVA